MNETMKIALGVTGFATLLALTVPANFDVSQGQTKTEPSASVQPEAIKSSNVKPVVPEQNSIIDTIIEDSDDETFSFGDPTSSAEPINFDDSSDTNEQTAPQGTIRSISNSASRPPASQSVESEPVRARPSIIDIEKAVNKRPSEEI